MNMYNTINSSLRKAKPEIYSSNSIFPCGFWEWVLVLFIVGAMTLSEIEGLSKIPMLYGVMFSALFVIYFLYHRVSLRFPPEVIVYFVWVIWSIGGMVNVIDGELYFKLLRTIVQIGILLFLVSSITALRMNMRFVLVGIVAGGILVYLYSMLTGEFQSVIDSSSMRAESLTGNANAFAYSVLFVIFSMFLFWRIKSSLIWRFIISAVIACSVILIVLSGSRKGFITLLAFIFLWWFYCRDKKFRKNHAKIFFISIILFAGIYFVSDYVMTKTYMGKRFETERVERSGTERYQLYMDGIEMMKRYPFFGVGLDNFRLNSRTGKYSHSDYIEVATNTGIIGFILYFSIYIILLRRLNRLKALSSDPSLMYTIGLLKAAIITILLAGLGTVHMKSKITWIFLACAIGYSWSIEQSLLSLKLYGKRSAYNIRQRYLENMRNLSLH